MLTPAQVAVRDARDYVLRRSRADVRQAWLHDPELKHSIDAREQILLSVAETLDELGVPESTLWHMAVRQFQTHIRLERDQHRVFAMLTEHHERTRPRWVGPPLTEPT